MKAADDQLVSDESAKLKNLRTFPLIKWSQSGKLKSSNQKVYLKNLKAELQS